jgi:hypothetical protein
MERPRRDGESQDALRHEEDAKHHPHRDDGDNEDYTDPGDGDGDE